MFEKFCLSTNATGKVSDSMNFSSHIFQGEEYKLFWPEQAEFVRMAARFGAKIVPFGSVGEDDLTQVSLQYLNHFVLLHCYQLLPNVSSSLLFLT